MDSDNDIYLPPMLTICGPFVRLHITTTQSEKAQPFWW